MKRYTCVHSGLLSHMVENPKGAWIKLEDYEMDINCLKERIKELEEENKNLNSALDYCEATNILLTKL